ncbi:MAG: nucleoside triphosphate pyrophosphohydrolase [Oscillospiraceae bacterium]|nr:nucleoside triphosphate pyrophosphohydrolase [Oscillospiraceae bacterium]
MEHKIILASKSPRRIELMREAQFDCEVLHADVDETIPDELLSEPREAAVFLAAKKAKAVLQSFQGNQKRTIIAADTIVSVDGVLFGKPCDADEATTMLSQLSGKSHSVFTGVVIFGTDGQSHSFCEETMVEFHQLSDKEIADYIKTGEPFDKAGGYGIQGRGMLLVKRIDGDYYNVMGLPISRVSRMLAEVGCIANTDFRRSPTNVRYSLEDLLAIMKRLRKDCPWDKEQTHSSIRVNVIEEAYEVAEAIDNTSPTHLCEELGDLLLQVVFHAQIASETMAFDFNDVCHGICEKLILRHPHIFSDTRADTTTEVLQNWETIKAESKGEQTATARINSVPKTLPALMRGQKVGKRAGDSGFDFVDVRQTFKSLNSELKELELAMLSGESTRIEEEFGDVLFSCCNLGRFLEKDCEKALTFSINRFIMRFRGLEEMVLNADKQINQLTPEQLDELWEKVKSSKP